MRLKILGALALASWLGATAVQARGYVPQGRCGPHERVVIDTVPAGHCVALVADDAQGLEAPRRILEVAPGRFWLIDMGANWVPKKGRLLELTLPPAPRAPACAPWPTSWTARWAWPWGRMARCG